MAKHYDTVETNPIALRGIASDIRAYTTCQVSIVREYLSIISAQECEITTGSYQEAILAMRAWLTRMEELKQHGDAFAQYLVDRAEQMEQFEKKKG